MEDTSSPPSSASASDSDAYNTESARLYFGPLKTPERKYVDMSKSLFPPTQTTLPRRSPRLSSPCLRSPSQQTDDNEDIDLVAQLIRAPGGDEEHFSDSATPQAGDGIEDEPSSILADRVLHALDNPSPPPGPALPLSFFDPYHATTPPSPTDYQNDILSLSMNSRPKPHDDNSLLLSTAIYSKALTLETHANLPSHGVLQQDLISLDSASTLQPSKGTSSSSLLKESVSVDQLQFPISVNSPQIQPIFEIPDLIVEPPPESLLAESVTVMGLAQTVESVEADSDIIRHGQLGVEHVSPQRSIIETPVRRSPRPRMSATPNVAPSPTVFSLPSSGARTQIKKKLTVVTFDESDDSQEGRGVEEDIVRQVPSQITPVLLPVKQRSPTRSPMSFNRVLGSLSPKSTDLLSKLAFASNEEPNHISGDGEPSSDNQIPFTVSMFPTLPEPVLSNTPSRSIGPVRFSSPTKSTPLHKIRLQTPVFNDPMNTPARRIPIEEGIAQGYVSPQKVARLCFKSDGTPLTVTQTPARRVLVSEHSAVPVTRPGIWFGSSLKGKERDQSVEPSSRAIVTKGKEKEKMPGQSSTETLAKSLLPQPDRLPFPLAGSDPAPSKSSQMDPEICQDNLPQAKPTNIKSYLRQPTSKIPRIGTKPYTRPPASKSREKDSSSLPKRTVNYVETLQKLTTVDSTSIPPNTSRNLTNSISRVRPTAPTPTSLLKRKREAEKPSPVKPRIITLRQVPKVVIPATTNSRARIELPTAPNLKKTSQKMGPRPIRVDSESSKLSHSVPQNHEGPTIVYNPPPARTVMKSSETREPPPPFPPGSPMLQDPPGLPHDLPEPQLKPELTVPDNIPTSDVPSNLRRITRSRRTSAAVIERNPRPVSTRRKSAPNRSDDIFSGMSITALKDLTISNTTRNQQYLIAKLETEVVRKEGVRPESPAVKIRTIVQRQMEEKMKERGERAIRRARRSDGDMTSSDVEGSSDVGYSSPSEDCSGESSHKPLTKHRRGPGDEEDYETPERPDRYKKTKLFVEADTQDDEPERRVKWDRGLFTTVYLDEVKLGTRQPLKENRSLKGILAPTAKALRLDTLGNLPQADLPLTELVQENVTIKKFVYDNDVVPVPELIVVKNTRSKSKKSRS